MPAKPRCALVAAVDRVHFEDLARPDDDVVVQCREEESHAIIDRCR